MNQASKLPNTVALLQHATFTRARRRIQTALCTLEGGIYDLLTTEDVVHLLSSALSDLDEVEIVEQKRTRRRVQLREGLDWNAYESVAGK